MPKISASEIIQAVVLLDQASAAIVRIFREGREAFSTDDEAALKTQLAALRQRNDDRYTEIEALLTARAAGTG